MMELRGEGQTELFVVATGTVDDFHDSALGCVGLPGNNQAAAARRGVESYGTLCYSRAMVT